ncbi:MAG TPA: DUF2267 domain-containing protein [Gemmatimonadaceae bacterium]|nr:DUF2267 domain-containing protein [Gemmatimonadaceae bacterium]
MPMPAEYQQPREQFVAFLGDVRDACEFGSTHQAYTTTQGVFQTFRRRLSLPDAIRFAGVLPGLLRALFVADWDPAEPQRPFAPREALLEEVRALRRLHNFTPDDAIGYVAWALRRHVDADALAGVLRTLPPGAADFWRVDDAEAIARRAAEWRALGPVQAS